jgi:hypothetical protein
MSAKFIIIGKGDHSMTPDGVIVGIGSVVVSQLRKKDLTEYIENGSKIPTIVTITNILEPTSTMVEVKDIFGKTYQTEIAKLEPINFSAFDLYASMQSKAKGINDSGQLGGGLIDDDYKKYIKYKIKYTNLKAKLDRLS